MKHTATFELNTARFDFSHSKLQIFYIFGTSILTFINVIFAYFITFLLIDVIKSALFVIYFYKKVKKC